MSCLYTRFDLHQQLMCLTTFRTANWAASKKSSIGRWIDCSTLNMPHLSAAVFWSMIHNEWSSRLCTSFWASPAAPFTLLSALSAARPASCTRYDQYWILNHPHKNLKHKNQWHSSSVASYVAGWCVFLLLLWANLLMMARLKFTSAFSTSDMMTHIHGRWLDLPSKFTARALWS